MLIAKNEHIDQCCKFFIFTKVLSLYQNVSNHLWGRSWVYEDIFCN